MFLKCMKVPDTVLPDYFRLTTDISEAEYSRHLALDIRQAHFVYAREIVRLYHGEEAISSAEQRYLTVAAGYAPDRIEILTVTEGEATVISLLKQAGFAASNADARRLIAGGGIKLDGVTVKDGNSLVRNGAILSRGKNHFVQILFG